MFGRLANPNGGNNVLSQVLYGLALRFVDLVPNWSLLRDNRIMKPEPFRDLLIG